MKTKFKQHLVLLSVFFFILTTSALASKIQVIPIKGNINGIQNTIVEEALIDAINNDADLVIFDIDTYGGFIDSAEQIKNQILSTSIPTVSYVNNKAESAGVLLAISSEKLVMHTSSTIGSAETIPNNEKVLSMWIAMLKDVAQYRDRNPEIIRSMADAKMSIQGLVEEGELTNLTGKDAVEYKIADFQASSYEEIAEKLELENPEFHVSKKSMKVEIASLLTNPLVNTLLLIIGFVGAVVELFMPGFGVGGVLSILGFGLFFAGNMVIGNADWVSLLLFILGGILIIVEILIPGFGLPGIAGVVLLLGGLITSMGNIIQGMVSLSVALIIATITGIVIVRKGFESPIMKKVVLSTNIEHDGTTSTKEEKFDLIGKRGKTLTVLRPSGTVVIEGKRYDVLTEGEYIHKDVAIEVIRVVGSKIFVRRI